MRAKVKRSCFFNQSISDTRPNARGCLPPLIKSASNNDFTSFGLIGPNPMRPEAVSTSTNVSNQNNPRELFREI